MPIFAIFGFLFGDRHLSDVCYRRIIPLVPRITQEGLLIWLWPVWREDSSSGYGTDSSWTWDYWLKLPADTHGKPVYRWPGLGAFDKWVVWAGAIYLAAYLAGHG